MTSRIDAALGALFLGLSGAVYLLTREMPPVAVEDGMSSAFFPLSMAAVIALLSLALIARGAFGKRESSEVPDGVGSEFSLLGPHLKIPANLTLIVAIYLSLLDFGGFLLATPIFILSMMRLFRASWTRSAVTGACVTAGIYVIFGIGLRIPLPVGQLLGN